MLLTDDEIYGMYSEPSSDAEMVAFARAVEAAILAKLASAELPEHTEIIDIDGFINCVYDIGDLRKAFAQGAASQLTEKPVAWLDDFGNAFPLGANKGAGSWMNAHKRTWKELFTRKEPK